jgi:hypothetical protein
MLIGNKSDLHLDRQIEASRAQSLADDYEVDSNPYTTNRKQQSTPLNNEPKSKNNKQQMQHIQQTTIHQRRFTGSFFRDISIVQLVCGVRVLGTSTISTALLGWHRLAAPLLPRRGMWFMGGCIFVPKEFWDGSACFTIRD